MAKNRKQSGIDVDWYLISIERLKQIGLVVLLLLLTGAGWWFWHNQKGNPKSNAESAIADARQALNSVAASPDFNAHRSEFNRAQRKLDEATAHLTAARFDQARDSAVVSLTISRAALNVTDPESDARFLTVEGNVEYQKGASGEWKDADPRLPLVNGDWVRTGPRASAELIFNSNGALYTVGPSALLEIYSTVNAQTSEKSTVVQMRVGSVEVATAADKPSTLRTPGTQVIVESESTTQVGVDKSNTTAVVSKRGAASVAPSTGGPSVRLMAGEKVSGTSQGTLSPVKKLVMAPGLMSPGDNQVFQLSPDLNVDLIWDRREGASGYMLQVSRSRLFSTQEINTRRTKTNAVAHVTKEGAFYWRVAAVGPDGDVGPFSTFRRFRVSGGTKSTTDRTPPKLTLKQPFHVGGQYYTIAGTTEPGATVFINDEEVDVESSGAFQKLIALDKVGQNTIVIKAVDAAGNQTVQSQTVNVEE